MRRAGIDIGSRTIKVVVIEGEEIVWSAKCENSFDTVNDCRKLLTGVEYDLVAATGYGRHLFAEHFSCNQVISEIKAFALGVSHLFPQCRTILDIGGQDTKAISIGANGALKKFEMNDRCAAGTGRFLEIMAMALHCPLADFSNLAKLSTSPQKINNMCTVFAESEVISMLAKGVKREDIAAGIMQSIILRSVSQLRRVGIEKELMFAGGVALNRVMVDLLGEQVGFDILTAPDPQILGALGAARANLG